MGAKRAKWHSGDDIGQAQHGGAVGDDADQIAAQGVVVGQAGVGLNIEPAHVAGLALRGVLWEVFSSTGWTNVVVMLVSC